MAREASFLLIRLVWEFLVHIFVGAALFVVLSLPPLGLARWVAYLDESQTPQFFITILELAEYLLFLLDAALFVVFVIGAFFRTARDIVRALRT